MDLNTGPLLKLIKINYYFWIIFSEYISPSKENIQKTWNQVISQDRPLLNRSLPTRPFKRKTNPMIKSRLLKQKRRLKRSRKSSRNQEPKESKRAFRSLQMRHKKLSIKLATTHQLPSISPIRCLRSWQKERRLQMKLAPQTWWRTSLWLRAKS